MNTIQSALPSETPTLRGNEEFEGAEHHVDVAEADADSVVDVESEKHFCKVWSE